MEGILKRYRQRKVIKPITHRITINCHATNLDWEGHLMKVLQIATSTDGGAGIAARRLNEALNLIGLDSVLLSGSAPKLRKNQDEITVIKKFKTRNLSRVVTVLQAKFVQKRNSLMTPFSLETTSTFEILKLKPDIIHLHTFYNLLSAKTISKICNLGIPIFITLHDERFYTGGCHYAQGCSNYEQSCCNCPEAKPMFRKVTVRSQNDLALAFNQNQHPVVIAPSEWISRRAGRSAVLGSSEIYKVNNPLSVEFIEKSKRPRITREDSSPYIITFVAQNLTNPFKGLETLLKCIRKYEQQFISQNIKFVFVGKGPEIDIGPLKYHQYDKIDSSKMIDIYHRSDLLIVPSLVDNSPNVIFEALACGTPLVGSDQSGIQEILSDFRMESFVYGDVDSMYQAIKKQKFAQVDSIQIREAALEIVHPVAVAEKIFNLYAMKSTEAS